MDTVSIEPEDRGAVKIAVALRAARAFVGMSQVELAERTGIPKVTLARVETLEGSLKAEQFIRIIDFFASQGVSIDMRGSSGLNVTITNHLLDVAGKRLRDETRRRTDRRRAD